MSAMSCRLAVVLLSLGSFVLSPADAQGMQIGCVMKHCGVKFTKAGLDPVFRKNTECELGCQKGFDNDTSPGKLHYQNCTTTCAITYDSPAGDAFLGCAMDNNCMQFPPIPGSCPYRKEHIQTDASLASLSGEFWQHRGYNALWDCYPCQHIHGMKLVNDSQWCAQTVSPKGAVQAPCWSYTYSYDLYLTNGSTKTYGQTWQLPSNTPAGEPIDIYYNYMGSWHNETWYIFKQTDNYVLLGDCSYMQTWVNVGSIVWVRPNHVLTDKENADIKEVYKNKLNISYDDFCYDTHGSDKCRDPTPGNLDFGQPPQARKQRWPAGVLAELASKLSMVTLV